MGFLYHLLPSIYEYNAILAERAVVVEKLNELIEIEKLDLDVVMMMTTTVVTFFVVRQTFVKVVISDGWLEEPS